MTLVIPGRYITKENSVYALLPNLIFWMLSLYNLVLSSFKDPGILEKGNLSREAFNQKDKEQNFYRNYNEIQETDEEGFSVQKMEKRNDPNIYT